MSRNRRQFLGHAAAGAAAAGLSALGFPAIAQSRTRIEKYSEPLVSAVHACNL